MIVFGFPQFGNFVQIFGPGQQILNLDGGLEGVGIDQRLVVVPVQSVLSCGLLHQGNLSSTNSPQSCEACNP